MNNPATTSYHDDLVPPLDKLTGWEKLTQEQQNKMLLLEQEAYNKRILLLHGQDMENNEIYARRCARMYEVRFEIMRILADKP